MFERIVAAMRDYTVVLEPDRDEPEWWAGAPSVLYDEKTFWLACRMREGNSPRGKRGYENRILRSADGRRFEPVHHILREDARVPGFERPALVRDPKSGKYRLYTCSGLDGHWGIIRFPDADSPDKIDPKSWTIVLQPEVEESDALGFIQVEGYKDPFVFHDGWRWHMFVIGYDRIERAYHFTSDDGDRWVAQDGGPISSARPILENTGWHNCFTRPACVMPMAVGYLLVYEGSSVTWRDPSYNIATGLAYSPDLASFVDLTPREPLLVSTTPGQYRTWRYSHWMNVGGEVLVYYEAARPNNTNEIRCASFPADWARAK